MAVYQPRRAAIAIILVTVMQDDICEELLGRHKRGRTKEWIRRRDEKGMYRLVEELRAEDTVAYKEMMRMNYETFSELLMAIEPEISKEQVIGGHKIIKPAVRLTLALRFLATGETFTSPHFQFRMGKATISYIIREVCEAIFKVLGPKYMSVPSTVEKWSEIANAFESRWQYPNCLGAIDGKHINIRPPTGSGSYYYNYKHTHSVVLMAVAGPNYECLYADVGTNGRIADGGVFNKCSLLRCLEEGILGIPGDKPLPFNEEPLPFVLLGDDAFALRQFLMKPFPQRKLTLEKRIYNYRHSRVRRLSENLLGILANRWRVFLTTMMLAPSFVEVITLSALTLHNLLCSKKASRQIYCPKGLTDEEDAETGELIPGSWRSSAIQMSSLPIPSTGHNPSNKAKEVRDAFTEYFCNEGSVPWQWERC